MLAIASWFLLNCYLCVRRPRCLVFSEEHDTKLVRSSYPGLCVRCWLTVLCAQAENTLRTLGDFVVHELEAILRAEVFQIMASRRQIKSSGAFLSKSVAATPAQVIDYTSRPQNLNCKCVL